MFDSFKEIFSDTPDNLGALADNRTDKEKAKDIKFEEIVAKADEVLWTEKSINQWRSFPVRNQYQSSSCVAQSMAKLLGILRSLEDGVFIDFSASYIYQKRINKDIGDGEGMVGVNAFDIVRQYGATLELLMPSQNLTEEQIDLVPQKDYFEKVGKIIGGIENYVQFTPKNSFETVASTIQKTKKGVMVWFNFGSGEWWKPVPTMTAKDLTMAHSVVATDFTLYKGKKALVIEDSSGPQKGFVGGRRLVTEDFFKARNIFSAYPIGLKNLEEQKPNKPKYTFTRTLKFSEIYSVDGDVIKLQDILKYEGFFPTTIDSTGYYGALTAKHVLAFQKKYQVASPAELDSLEGKVVGPSTIAKLNQLYSN